MFSRHGAKFRGIFLFFLFSILLEHSSFGEILSVQGNKVSLRADPDTKGSILFEYGEGFPVEVQKKQADWVLVKDFENDSGWIHKTKLQKSKQVIVIANKDQENSINIRSSPTTKSPVVANAFYGVVFSIIEKKGEWVHVRHETGLKGWVKANFLWGV